MKVIAHRGCSAREPENTLAAFRAAWRSGCHGIELDVQATVDRRLVVFHDEDGMRLTGHPECVAQIPWSQMATWRVRHESIPLLPEVLREAPCGSMTLVELKSSAQILDPVLECIKSIPSAASGVAILSFNEQVAASVAERGFPAWLNVESNQVDAMDREIERWKNLGFKAVSMGFSDAINRRHVEIAHRAGLLFATWTLNNPRDAVRARAIGVDTLMTDDPERIMKALEDAG